MYRHVLRIGCLAGLAAAVAGARAQDAARPADAAGLVREFHGLLQEYVALEPPPFRASLAQQREWRERIAPQIEQLTGRVAGLAQRSGGAPDVLLLEALLHARRANILLDERRELDRRVAQLRADEQEPPAELLAQQADQAIATATAYRLIVDRLQQALSAAERLRQQREMGLVEGVVLAQTAIVEDRALDVAQAAERETPFAPEEVRQFLDDAQSLLQAYLEATPLEHGLEWVRGRFYLGVVEYRRALKPRVVGEPYFTEVDPERTAGFERAREIFTTLSTPEAVLAILRPHATEEAQRESPAGQAFETSSFALQANYSYEAVAQYYAASSNLYLGLMAAIDPALEGRADERLEAARSAMDRAAALDMSPPQPGEPAISLTNNTVPVSRERVLTELERAVEAAPVRRPINDVAFSIGGAYLWDTNVTLLGDRTAAPPEISRRSDSRYPVRFRVNWLADLDAFDEGNEQLRRWQVFVEGRIDSTWNAHISEFNEQFYGATVNLRYELIGPDQVDHLDALYAHVRYDYDHVVLGNDGFLTLNRLRPMLQYVLFDGRVDGSVFFSYENRDYSELLRSKAFNRDGDYYSVGADVRLDLGDWIEGEALWGEEWTWGGLAPLREDFEYRRPMELAFGYEFTNNSTDGDEFDYSSHIFSTGLRFPLPLGIDFLFAAAWEWQDYWQHSVVDRLRRYRDGEIQEYTWRLERRLFLTDYSPEYLYIEPLQFERIVLTLFGEVRWIRDDNNVVDRVGQRPFEYDRAIYGLGLRVDFN